MTLPLLPLFFTDNLFSVSTHLQFMFRSVFFPHVTTMKATICGLLLLALVIGACANAVTEHGLFGRVVRQDGEILLERSTEAPVSSLNDLMNRMQNYAAAKTTQFGDDYLEFLPQFGAAPLPGQVAQSWTNGRCFQKNTAEIPTTVQPTADGSLSIILDMESPKNKFCSDLLLFATPYRFHVAAIFTHGKHTVKLAGPFTDPEWLDVKTNGIRIFSIHSSTLMEIKSLFDTMQLFIGGRMVEDNVQLLKDHANITLVERPAAKYDPVMIPEDEIKSGTYLGITRLDGLDPMVMVGTGSRFGHTAVALRFYENENDTKGTLYICESTDKNPFGKIYWDPPFGIIRNTYAKWMEMAVAAEYMVIMAPLSPENQAKFDERKAADWFFTVQGCPYGYHNFVYGWIDTVSGNIPPPLSADLLVVALPIADRLLHANISSIFTEGMNKRLQTYHNVPVSQACDTIDCVIAQLDKINTPLMELISEVELDEWKFSDGCPSMVCDVFVLKMYQEAGIFPGLTFQATEATPRDVYQLKIFDDNWQHPEACTSNGRNALNFPYCQVLGKYWANIVEDKFNSIEPYSHMNEHCSAMPYDYAKPAGC
jgi:hypothetical protein